MVLLTLRLHNQATYLLNRFSESGILIQQAEGRGQILNVQQGRLGGVRTLSEIWLWPLIFKPGSVAPPENLLEMQNLGPLHRLPEPELTFLTGSQVIHVHIQV